MGHKVTVEKIDWDGIADELESIDKPQASNPKPKRLYTIGAAFVAILLLFTSINIMISAQSPSIPTVIEPGSMVGTYSYIIFPSDGSYYARNGTTGTIDYTGIDAYTVITDAITHSSGGTVFLRNGIYPLAQVLDLSHQQTNLIGESALNTILQRSGDVLILNFTRSPPVFDRWSLLTIDNLAIDGVSTSGIGVDVVYGAQETISKLQIRNCSIGLRIRGAIDCVFNDITAQSCNVGILMEETDSYPATYENNGNRFFGGYLGECDYGLVISNMTKGNTFNSMILENNAVRDIAIRCYDTNPGPQRNQFIGCFFEYYTTGHISVSWNGYSGGRTPGETSFKDCMFATIQFPFVITGDQNTVESCDFTYGGYPPGAYLNVSGDNNVFINNKGWTYPDGGKSYIWVKDTGKNNTWLGNSFYVTVQTGIAYISSSTTVTFYHNLGRADAYGVSTDAYLTPTIISASFNSTAVTGWTWTATGTQVTVTVDVSGTYTVYWFAEAWYI
jgi:hypothetical protein